MHCNNTAKSHFGVESDFQIQLPLPCLCLSLHWSCICPNPHPPPPYCNTEGNSGYWPLLKNHLLTHSLECKSDLPTNPNGKDEAESQRQPTVFEHMVTIIATPELWGRKSSQAAKSTQNNQHDVVNDSMSNAIVGGQPDHSRRKSTRLLHSC
jgi:hypothetical protein